MRDVLYIILCNYFCLTALTRFILELTSLLLVALPIISAHYWSTRSAHARSAFRAQASDVA